MRKEDAEKRDLFVVQDGGVRLDAFLSESYTDLSRSFLQGLVRRGCVRVNGKEGAGRDKLRAGDRIEVFWPEPEAGAWDPERAVLFEDRQVLFLEKPSGLLVHPMGDAWTRSERALWASGEQTLIGAFARIRPEVVKQGVERFGLVHRLDRGTSGVLVLAKTPEAHRSLLEAWQERQVEKVYRAFVHGAMPKGTGVFDKPIHRFTGARRLSAAPWGREARTEYKVRRSAKALSEVEARPVTGRTHQIRIHLAAAGHPVLGDVEYAKKTSGDQTVPRLMLHAWKLSLPHPKTGRKIEATSRIPKVFSELWKRLAAT